MSSKLRKGSSSSSGGMGICSVLFFIFLTLKLLKIAPVAAWSWWAVTSPLWIGFAVFLALVGLILGGGLLIALFSK